MKTTKRINVILANGLCVLRAKFRDQSRIATLFITDYTNDAQVMFDIEQKRVIHNSNNIDINPKDIENLVSALTESKKAA